MAPRTARVISVVPLCLALVACSNETRDPELASTRRSALVTVVENRSLAVTHIAPFR